MDYAGMVKILADVEEEYEREMKRAIRQRSVDKAHDAMVGQESVERIRLRMGLAENAEREQLAAIEDDLRRAFRPPRKVARVKIDGRRKARPELVAAGGPAEEPATGTDGAPRSEP